MTMIGCCCCVIALCFLSVAITNATTIMATPPAMMAAPTARLASPPINTGIQLRSPESRFYRKPIHSRRFMTTARNCPVAHAHVSLRESSAPKPFRPVPKPCQTNTGQILFHQLPSDRDTCLLDICDVNVTHMACSDLQWLLEMALEKLLVSGYRRAAFHLSQQQPLYSFIQQSLTELGFQANPSAADKCQETDEIWVKDLAPVMSQQVSTPMMTLSGAVPYTKKPELFSLDADSLSYGSRRLDEFHESVLADLLDMKLQKLRAEHHSHAAVCLDPTYRDYSLYKLAARVLEQLGFQRTDPHPLQKFNIANGELWLKTL